MALPFFFMNDIDSTQSQLGLDESTSKHVLQVLRMKTGEQMHITDGKGNVFVAIVDRQEKKQCLVKIIAHHTTSTATHQSIIAVSLIKNAGRFEWFIEKAVEMGVTHIVPLLCERTERIHFRADRMQSIMVSAMLQSQQAWLPVLQEPVRFEKWIAYPQNGTKCIAHCLQNEKKSFKEIANTRGDISICIGPEGDFTDNEIQLALGHAFVPVSLGETRLRTETAALVAAALLRIA
jgi:16S rRNA (uracil1498-N3)-methyltransferase